MLTFRAINDIKKSVPHQDLLLLAAENGAHPKPSCFSFYSELPPKQISLHFHVVSPALFCILIRTPATQFL